MKQKFVQAIAMFLILFCSCKKSFLEQSNPDAITVSQYFVSETDVLLALNGCYNLMRSNSALGEESDLYTDQRSDDTGTNDNQSNAGEPFQFNNFSLLPTNSYLYGHWKAMFAVIAQCNQVLANINKVTFTDSLRPQYTAEAQFLRALILFHLVRKWGDIPMTTVPLTTPAQITDSTYRVKTPLVYNQIIADLTAAAHSGLPVVQPSANRGHASLQAVNFLLGQVYLTKFATLDGGNSGAAPNSDLDSANYYLTTCYNERTFTNLSGIPYTDNFNVAKKATCPELIWQIVFIQGDPTYYSHIAADAQAQGEVVNVYFKRVSSGVGYNVTHDLVKEYEANDPRATWNMTYDTFHTVKDWYVSKFRDTSAAAGQNGYGGNDFPMMRYADVILMLAEVNMYYGKTAQAIQYLDIVRTRAGLPTYEVSSSTDPNYMQKFPNLKLAILHERRSELAFEHHRWFDLLRFFSINDLVTYIHSKNQADWGLAQIANFSTKDEYYPIPYNETILDPVKMYQNPGY
ncbi:RagB/SusD family nutrient uptake outer membrane protein [Puia dinghuensis]|uniref:Membrane protein n=1 Tax=Puia dinghuensis TaxID=1792502 RepID=A0A8J2UH06_9BACT|nr:RagB/SusD family nutrient uptake outer membrane protein [Puia dinghuensis]GGB16868.1 membrane protein [Puia dinghuensis]